MTRHLLSTSLLVGLLAGSALAQTPPPPGHLRVQLEATVESDDDAVFRWTLDPMAYRVDISSFEGWDAESLSEVLGDESE